MRKIAVALSAVTLLLAGFGTALAQSAPPGDVAAAVVKRCCLSGVTTCGDISCYDITNESCDGAVLTCTRHEVDSNFAPTAAAPTSTVSASGSYCCPTEYAGQCCKACNPPPEGLICPDGTEETNCASNPAAVDCKAGTVEQAATTDKTPTGAAKFEYDVPNFAGTNSIIAAIGKLGSVMTGIVGTIAFAMFVWGGFLILTARGNSTQVGKAKNIFVWTVIGLVVVFGSQAILTALFNILSQGSI